MIKLSSVLTADVSLFPKVYAADSAVGRMRAFLGAGFSNALFSFAYYKKFLASDFSKFGLYSSCLDSGAFTAHTMGKKVDISMLVDWYTKNKESGFVDFCFSLDVIGNAKESQKNCDTMYSRGCCVVPTFHYGGDWLTLKEMCSEYPIVGLGGIAVLKSQTQRERWVSECFNRQWPHLFHGLGVGAKWAQKYPFFSVDATTFTKNSQLTRSKPLLATYEKCASNANKRNDECMIRWGSEIKSAIKRLQ